MTQWILTSSLLIVALIALRAVFRKRISSRMQYAMWALVLLRLLIPYFPVQTPVSVMNLVEPPVQNVIAPALGEVPLVTGGRTDHTPMQDPALVVSPTVTETTAAPQVNLSDVLQTLWVVGSAATAAWLLGSNLHFAAKLRRHRTRLDGLDCPLPVYHSDAVLSPCLFGRSIYLTDNALTDATKTRHILTHELCHWRQLDPLWSVLRCVCLVIWWWNPLVWAAALLSRHDCEASCDELAIQRLGETQRLAYGETLVGMLVAAPVFSPVAATTMSSRDMKDRLQLIVRQRKVWIPTVIVVALIAAVCVICTFTGADDPSETPTKAAVVIYQETDADGLLVGIETNETVRIQPNDTLSEATMDSLREGDTLIVRYRNRTRSVIDALSITVKPLASVTLPPDTPVEDLDASSDDRDATVETPPTEAPDEPAKDPVETPDDPVTIDEQALIDLFDQEVFNTDGFSFYRQALTSQYASPAQVDLLQLFYNGADGMSTQMSRVEQSLIRQHDESLLTMDTTRITGGVMDEMLWTYFGIGLADTQQTGLDAFLYLPEFDLYHYYHGDTNALRPIAIHGVEVDADGYHYVRYDASDRYGDAEQVCCLREVDGQWQIVYNLPVQDDLPAGADAVVTPSGAAHLSQPLNLEDALISNDLDYAISNVVLDEMRDFIPWRNYTNLTEAHVNLAMQHYEDGTLSVYTLAMAQAERVDLSERWSLYLTIQIDFRPQTSVGRVFYEPVMVSYAEDPEEPGNLHFQGEQLPNIHAYLPKLEQACQERLEGYNRDSIRDIEAYYATLSGYTAEEAAQNAADAMGGRNFIISYHLLGVEENEKTTEANIEGLLGSDLAASYGWSDDYIREHIRAIEVTYNIAADHTMAPITDGVFIRTYYVCEDPDSGVWRVWDHNGGIELFGFTANN